MRTVLAFLGGDGNCRPQVVLAGSRQPWPLNGLLWAGLDAAVLGWAGLGCIRLGCAVLGWAVLGCTGLGCAGLCWGWAVLGCAELGLCSEVLCSVCAGLCWAALGWAGLECTAGLGCAGLGLFVWDPGPPSPLPPAALWVTLLTQVLPGRGVKSVAQPPSSPADAKADVSCRGPRPNQRVLDIGPPRKTYPSL